MASSYIIKSIRNTPSLGITHSVELHTDIILIFEIILEITDFGVEI